MTRFLKIVPAVALAAILAAPAALADCGMEHGAMTDKTASKEKSEG